MNTVYRLAKMLVEPQDSCVTFRIFNDAQCRMLDCTLTPEGCFNLLQLLAEFLCAYAVEMIQQYEKTIEDIKQEIATLEQRLKESPALANVYKREIEDAQRSLEKYQAFRRDMEQLAKLCSDVKEAQNTLR